MMHEIKILPEFFWPVVFGVKNFEVRKNDRPYAVGDYLRFLEYIDGKPTFRDAVREIKYILDDPRFCKEGFVILGI